MATITLKNIPDPTYQTLKQLAAEHHRSLNGEIIHLIERATKSSRFEPDQYLLAALTMRKKTAQYPATDALLSELKNAGRP